MLGQMLDYVDFFQMKLIFLRPFNVRQKWVLFHCRLILTGFSGIIDHVLKWSIISKIFCLCCQLPFGTWSAKEMRVIRRIKFSKGKKALLIYGIIVVSLKMVFDLLTPTDKVFYLTNSSTKSLLNANLLTYGGQVRLQSNMINSLH